MDKSKRIKFLGTEDRVGMIYDVLNAMVSYGINIIAMETDPYICCKIKWDDNLSWPDFKDFMKNEVKEITDIIELDLLSFEKKELELKTIINNIDEGIIGVNKEGRIVYFNKKAQKLLGLDYVENNLFISEVLPIDIFDMSDQWQEAENIEIDCKNRMNNRLHLLSDIRIIKNESGIITCALIIFREMDNIRQLIQTINRPSMITFDDILGKSRRLLDAISLAKTVAPSNSSIMLRGESGTGKELFARAIHMSSRRRNNPFVAINCAAVPDNLLESEFFGYEKGAFTGANSAGKQGLFELATHGTLFLDEIGDLSPRMQAKILRVIQEQKVRRLGGKHEIPINIRIISATNKNLEAMIEDGNFREDLYYRLNVIPIYIPALRERKDDISILSKNFIRAFGKEVGKPNLNITDESLEVLENYHWPGNIRELQNVLERAVILAEDEIQIQHLQIDRIIPSVETSSSSYFDFEGLPIDLPELIKKVEYNYLKKACKNFKSSREIAKALGISHTTVINKMKKYDL